MNLGGQVQDIQYMTIESNEIGVLKICACTTDMKLLWII
jgi:hypothetical protein